MVVRVLDADDYSPLVDAGGATVRVEPIQEVVLFSGSQCVLLLGQSVGVTEGDGYQQVDHVVHGEGPVAPLLSEAQALQDREDRAIREGFAGAECRQTTQDSAEVTR